jgi:hypothetical protein
LVVAIALTARWRAERPYKQEPRSGRGRGWKLGDSKSAVRSVSGPCGRSMAVAKREPRPNARGGVSGTHVRVWGDWWRAPLGKHMGAPEVPHGTSGAESPQDTRSWKPAALLLTGHYAQAPAVLDHSRTLPQGDGRAGPAFAGGAEGGERDLIVLDARDMLHDAFAVRCPSIDAEGEVSSHRGHLRPFGSASV